jgi:hypothetical protein
VAQVILVGAGYSVKEGIDLGLWREIRKQNVWSINYAYQTMPFVPSAEIWQDLSFWVENQNSLHKLYVQGCCLFARCHEDYKNSKEISCFESTPTEFYGRDAAAKGKIFTGRMGLTGVFALSLAVAKKYKTIYLLGYDFGSMSVRDTNTHFYQDAGINPGASKHPSIYMYGDKPRSEVTDFDLFLDVMKEDDLKIYNVSPNSNISSFPKIGYEEFFRRLNHG